MNAPRYSLRALLLYVGFWALALGIFLPFAHSIQMHWWWGIVIAASGGIVGLFSGRGGKIFSLSAGAWGMPIGLLAVPVLASTLWLLASPLLLPYPG